MHVFPIRPGLRPALVTAALATSAALAPASNESLRQVAPIAELWEEPRELEKRDLFLGPPSDQVPPPVAGAGFQFVAEDSSGASPGFEVVDSSGRHWDVKLGVEAQSEVAASRILWAVGFHQRPTYHVSSWVLTGRAQGPQPEARFRPKLPGERVIGDWSWRDNPFVGTREYGGLIVVNLILNNWDWKTSNNKIYEGTGADGTTRRLYVVRDLGASLGRTAQPALLSALGIRNAQGTKNDLAGFEAQGFVQLQSDGRLDFDYHGLYDDVVARVNRADLKWACDLLSRLSDRQLAEAFRAGGYSPDQTARYVLKLKQKIAQGLAASVEGQ